MPKQEPQQTYNNDANNGDKDTNQTSEPLLHLRCLFYCSSLCSNGFTGVTAVFLKMLPLQISYLDKQ